MKPGAADAGDLSQLHDIVLPPPTSWWPPAPAWFVLAGILVVGLLLLVAELVSRRRTSRYRRAALKELKQIEAAPDRATALPELAELVKRTALAVYPRERVAGLTGAVWLQFLDASASMTSFTQGSGRQLETVYERGTQRPTPELMVAVQQWIQQHRVDYT